MDNRINEFRRKISALRVEMSKVEARMRSEIARDQNCSGAALQLMSLRAEVASLARLRTGLGDTAPIGRVDIRKPRFAKG